MLKLLPLTIACSFMPFAVSAAYAEGGNTSGFYVGGNIGYGSGHYKDKGDEDSWGHNIDGLTGGIQLGHNWKFNNNMVLGIKTEFSMASIDGNYENREHAQYDAYYGSASIKQSGSFDFIIGREFDGFLPYVKYGLTVAKQNFSMGCDRGLVSPDSRGCTKGGEYQSDSNNISVGQNIGFGLQYQLTESFSVGIEYTYVNLGSSSVYLEDPNYPNKSKRNYKTTYDTTTLQLNYHF